MTYSSGQGLHTKVFKVQVGIYIKPILRGLKCGIVLKDK